MAPAPTHLTPRIAARLFNVTRAKLQSTFIHGGNARAAGNYMGDYVALAGAAYFMPLPGLFKPRAKLQNVEHLQMTGRLLLDLAAVQHRHLSVGELVKCQPMRWGMNVDGKEWMFANSHGYINDEFGEALRLVLAHGDDSRNGGLTVAQRNRARAAKKAAQDRVDYWMAVEADNLDIYLDDIARRYDEDYVPVWGKADATRLATALDRMDEQAWKGKGDSFIASFLAKVQP